MNNMKKWARIPWITFWGWCYTFFTVFGTFRESGETGLQPLKSWLTTNSTWPTFFHSKFAYDEVLLMPKDHLKVEYLFGVFGVCGQFKKIGSQSPKSRGNTQQVTLTLQLKILGLMRSSLMPGGSLRVIQYLFYKMGISRQYGEVGRH